MKLNLKILLPFCLIFLFPTLTLSQVAYECTIDQVINGSNLEVSVYIQSTGVTTFKIGGANFRMNLNTAALDISSIPTEIEEGLWDYDNDPDNYEDQGIGRNESAGWVSIDIFGKATLDGIEVPGAATLVGTMSIPITNTSLNSDVAWRVTGLNRLEIIDTDLNDVTGNGTFVNPGTPFPLPVELISFTANAKENKVELSWETETEVHNYGFEVERASIVGEGERLWNKLSFVEGHGNSNSPKSYQYMDKNPWGGSKFVYRLKQIDTDGEYEYSDEVEVELVPAKYELYQNYPNPFNPMTNIKFSLPEDAKVSIKIYDILGAFVDELVNKDYQAGYHKVEFNSSRYASGVYIYRLETKNFTNVKKMVLMK